jgi:hypothetical protein
MQPNDGASHVISAGHANGYKSQGGAFSYHPAGTQFSILNGASEPRPFVLIEVKN